jgi:hypothetical protein
VNPQRRFLRHMIVEVKQNVETVGTFLFATGWLFDLGRFETG